jgi:hypothetical protein
MCVDRFNAADFTAMSLQLSSVQGSLHRQMGIIFFRVRATPICLPCVTLDHYIGFLSRVSSLATAQYNSKPLEDSLVNCANAEFRQLVAILFLVGQAFHLVRLINETGLLEQAADRY